MKGLFRWIAVMWFAFAVGAMLIPILKGVSILTTLLVTVLALLSGSALFYRSPRNGGLLLFAAAVLVIDAVALSQNMYLLLPAMCGVGCSAYYYQSVATTKTSE